MNLLLLLVLAIPVGCLALLSLVAFLGVMALAGALRMVGAIYSGLGLGSADGNQDPWHGMVGDAHPLDYVEGAPPQSTDQSPVSGPDGMLV